MATIFKRGGKKNRHGYYYIQWFDAEGKRRSRCAKTTDREAAQQLANRLENEAMKRRDGIIDATAERIALEGRRPLEDHFANFEAKLRAAGRSVKHIGDTLRQVRDAAAFARWDDAGAINTDAANRFVETLRAGDRSARTIQSYLIALKSFTRWLHREGKLPADPLAGLKRPNPATDRRHERRALLADEWPWLEAAARGGPDRYGMTGPERATLYRLAIETGLRSGELRSLTRSSLRLDDEAPCVVVKARSTKNKKDARQFVGPDLTAALRGIATTKAPAAPLFDLPHACNVVRMLRADLAAARRAWLKAAPDSAERLRREEADFLAVRNHAGLVFDFHSLRHTTGTWLSASGASPKTVQSIMRHSVITLTLDTYGHLLPGQEVDAVGRLGEIFAPRIEETTPEALAATGTDGMADEVAQHWAQHSAQQLGGETWQVVASGGEESTGGEAEPLNANALRAGGSGDARRRLAKGGEVVRAGIEPATHGFSVFSKTPDSAGKTPSSAGRAALGAAVGAESRPSDPELSTLLEAWPRLPEAIRRGIMAMIEAAGPKSGEGRADR